MDQGLLVWSDVVPPLLGPGGPGVPAALDGALVYITKAIHFGTCLDYHCPARQSLRDQIDASIRLRPETCGLYSGNGNGRGAAHDVRADDGRGGGSGGGARS